MIIRTDVISEVVNDSDTDGSSFSEFSDSDTCTMEYILITRNKNFFSIIIHMSVSSLQDYWSLRPIIHTPYVVSIEASVV
jgi:hypothetical protein